MTRPQMQMSRMDMRAVSENAAPDASRLAALTIGADARGVKPRGGTSAAAFRGERRLQVAHAPDARAETGQFLLDAFIAAVNDDRRG